MDVTAILDPLNDAQREAVTAPAAPRLILAGAGSGKTRVLVHRIAWLMSVEGVAPYGVLAVTFTNKAAAEMRGRIEQMLGRPVGGMWVGTFHGLAHRLLRAHWQEAGLPQAFQILDSDDQFRFIKRLIRTMEIDEARWPPRQVQWFINHHKDEGQRSAHLELSGDHYQDRMIEIYTAYEQACNRSGLVDFAELLLRALELIRDNESVQEHYHQRFAHILVDEFQDTNAIQYAWIRLLAGERGNVFVVGDDDQSIYGWRGARIENIQRFCKDYSAATTIRLEQNYRSTSTILTAANSLIENNSGRLGKNLWTAGDQGEPIRLYAAYNEQDEAAFVLERIRDWVDQGNLRSETAILYRSNAQSRVFEEKLMAMAMPYRVYGGLRFFERAEIKDALSYLRLLQNQQDDAAFERIVNVPARGIGDRSLVVLRGVARERSISMWDACLVALDEKPLAARALNALTTFQALIRSMAQQIEGLPLYEQVEHVLEGSSLLALHQRDSSEKAESRLENLQELITAARGYEPGEEQADMNLLDSFLAHAALEAGENQADAWEDCVQLMTLHSAKGLEFPMVFMCGLEEGLFPHQRSIEDLERLEEERRLCYVGMTRAMSQLYMTYAESRRLHGTEKLAFASRFLKELPAEQTEEVRPVGMAPRAQSLASPAWQDDEAQDFGLGDRVMHGKFGEGVVLNYEGQGNHARVQVQFEFEGSKWLVLAYANLQRI